MKIGENSDEERKISDEKTALSHANSAADTGNIEIEQNCEMDKVSLLKNNHVHTKSKDLCQIGGKWWVDLSMYIPSWQFRRNAK